MTPVFLAAALVLTAPQLKERPKVDPLLGRWSASALTVHGKQDPQWNGLEYEFAPAGRWIIYRNAEEMSGGPRTYVTGQTTNPWTMDLTEGAAGKPMPGIYRIDGDVLTIAFHMGQGERPVDFAPAPGVMTMDFRRVKDK